MHRWKLFPVVTFIVFALPIAANAQEHAKVGPLTIKAVLKQEGDCDRGKKCATRFRVLLTVTADARFAARITTLTGKTINALEPGRIVNADDPFHILWNGRSQKNEQMRSGCYVLELKAWGRNGATVTVKRPLVIIE